MPERRTRFCGYVRTRSTSPPDTFVAIPSPDSNASNGYGYAFKGLFGGFPGHFYVMPYYMKIQPTLTSPR